MSPFRESIVSLKRKYLKNEAEESTSLSQPSVDGILDAIAKEGCGSLLEEVFLDLEVGTSASCSLFWAEMPCFSSALLVPHGECPVDGALDLSGPQVCSHHAGASVFLRYVLCMAQAWAGVFLTLS